MSLGAMALRQHLFLAAAVSVLVFSVNFANAGLKGAENWKERFRSWESSEPHNNGGTAISNVVAKQDQEDFNSVWDSPSEKESLRNSIISEKQKTENSNARPLSEITAWHDEKKERKMEERRLRKERYNQHPERRRQPREYRLEQQNRENLPPNNPPPHEKYAEMARYIVHNSDWGALAYTSRHPGSNGRAMADVLSISDGSGGNSTGIPYMYVTPRDMGIQDLAKDSHCSLALTLAQGDYCRKESLDPEDPRCAHVFLNGRLKTLKNGSEEWTHAKKYFFDRHPHLENMPADHKFRLVKLKISQVIVQDYFGGPAFPTLAEYFAAKPELLKNTQPPVHDEAAELLPGVSSTDLQRAPIP